MAFVARQGFEGVGIELSLTCNEGVFKRVLVISGDWNWLVSVNILVSA
jgi:hypothetical protein